MLVRNGKLITPDVTSSILESITRDTLLTLAREDLGLLVEERPVDRTELYLADEVFLCAQPPRLPQLRALIGTRLAMAHLGRLPSNLLASITTSSVASTHVVHSGARRWA